MSGPDRLKAFLEKHAVSLVAFAATIRSHPASVGNYIASRRKPDLKAAFAIERATFGEVPAESWLEVQP